MTTKLIPAPSIEELVGTDSIYHKLVSLENEVNYRIARKQSQMTDALFKTVKAKRTLKVLVSHTFEEIPMAGIAVEETSKTSSTWTLRVEGRLGIAGRTSKVVAEPFQHYLKSIVIQLGDTQHPVEQDTVEWVKDPASLAPLTDGFEVRRRAEGDEIPVKIFLRLDEQPERFQPSLALAPLVYGKNLISKPASILAVWQYVKSHKLQESDEKKTVHCDETLSRLFDSPSISFSELPRRLEPHLLPPAPLVIDYVITRERAGGGRTWEFEIEIEDPTKSRPLSSPSLLAQQREIGMLEHRIHEVSLALRATVIQERLMRLLEEDPLKCFQQLMEAQCADQQVMAGEPPISLADISQSRNFNTEEMERAVSLFWATSKRSQ